MATRVNKRGAGRPLKHALELPLYDSMEMMSSATGIPLAALKHAKKNGCLFVRHGRCELSVFLKWFFNQDGSDEDVDWAKRDKRAKALMSEIELEKKRDRVIDFASADSFLRRLVRAHFFGELDRLAHEFPAGLKGKNEVQIHEEVVRQIESIKSNLENEMATWDEAKGGDK
jgi:hypothetical protein